jgi:hypothetical protein
LSFGSIIGKIGGTIGKIGLGAVGGVVGVNGLANVFDKSKPAPTAYAPTGVAASLAFGVKSVDSQNSSGGSISSSIRGLIDSATGFLSGRTHVQADVHTQLGGTVDQYGQRANPLPSWLLPAGIGVAILLLLMSGGKRR